ncbi:MAG: ABC transporter permease [Candidatus Nezhaarchaeota archaeon]|nr:ABC transporter permease [Candidatus Nezhaarchaeota archaeon]MCX8142521.1 ABC transporter permease [Candidatus Nezhaarchaeota archaeon]MDW8050506.1 ABC transporter permease [Nitrososphaerota archaeon]
MLPKRYIAKRALFLALTLVIATYITVLVANAGGFIDNIIKSQVQYSVSTSLARDPIFARLPEDEKQRIIEERVQAILSSKGFDKPFIVRSFIYLVDALTLNLGRAITLRSAAGSSSVAAIILERLPQTILLFTTGTIVYILVGTWFGLRMARKPGRLFDRFMVGYAIITSVIPPWFFGILFILIFSFYLNLFPYGGLVSVPPPPDPVSYALDVLYHLALPMLTWVFSLFGYWAYITRNIVIQIASEDHVVAAKAKGLPESMIIRKHILRPALPPIVTNAALALIASWMGAIITETVFNWPGLGSLLYAAIESLDAPVIIGITVVYAYLLVITVLVLDVMYGILDPRIKVAG